MNDITRREIAAEAHTSFLEYSMSVITSRALPDARDGLKPSQRRILLAMHDLRLSPGAQHRKCAKISGDTSGNYHPHGEAVIYPTLVHMAQPWSLRYPLVDGQGNFGSPDGDPAAAMRYTEARLTALGQMMLEDLDKKTVDMKENYDGTQEEPVVFPAVLPNLLLNGTVGIAVGMATNIPPHNLGEMLSLIVACIDNPNISLSEILQILPGPDFPTGAQLYGQQGIVDYIGTGRGSFRLRSQYHIEPLPGGKCLVVYTQLPYYIRASDITARIAALSNEKLIDGVVGVQDESTEAGPRIAVELKRDANPDVLVNNLFKLTDLETGYSANMLGLCKGEPVQMGIRKMIEIYIDHRKEVVARRTQFALNKAEAREHILQGFRIVLDHLTEVIEAIRAASGREDACSTLMARFNLTEVQADAVLDMRLYQVSGMEREKIDNELAALVVEILRLQTILATEAGILAVIREEVLAIHAKHSDPRRTEIIIDQSSLTNADLILRETTVVTLSHQGLIKRTSATAWKSQRRGGKGVVGMKTAEDATGESDYVEHLLVGDTHATLLLFTNTGRVYAERVFMIPNMERTGKGRGLRQVFDLQDNETVAAMVTIDGFTEDQCAFLCTANGTVKKTTLSEYANVRKAGIIAIGIDEGDALIGARVVSAGNEVVLVTHEGMSIRFNQADARAMGRSAFGVTGIRLDTGDRVVSLEVVDPTATLLVASDHGVGKRTSFDDYRIQTRAGKGVITMKTSKKSGLVVGATAVHDTDQLILVTSRGQVVRQSVAEIREAGRATTGVTLIRLDEGDKLQCIARIAEVSDEDLAAAEAQPVPGGETPEAQAPVSPDEPHADEPSTELAEPAQSPPDESPAEPAQSPPVEPSAEPTSPSHSPESPTPLS